MGKLTKRVVDALPLKSSDYFEWDSELRGFGVRVSPKGAKTFMIQYRAGGRTRRVKICRYGTLAVDEARDRAKTLLGNVAGGQNPAEAISKHRGAPTVGEVCDRFLKDHVDVKLKPSTARDYRTIIEAGIRPALGTYKIVDVARADVAELHHRRRDTPYQANRILSVLSKMFNMAEVWGFRPDGSNPCRHVKRNAEKRKERFLSREELGSLGDVLAEAEESGSETPYVVPAIRLLVLTGCRRSEIQFLKWEYVKKTHIDLPDSKTGRRMVPLPAGARRVLESLSRVPDNPYVIVGEVEGQAINNLEKPWRRVRKSAELEDVRLHDLRHTYASNAILAGLSIPMLGKILGHTQIQTTMRYAHLADEPVRAAADVVAEGLEDGLLGISAQPNFNSDCPKISARPGIPIGAANLNNSGELIGHTG